MLKKNLCMGSIIISIFIWGITVQAEKPSIDVSAGITRVIGDTTYAIGNIPANEDYWGRDPFFPISELVFPIFGYYGSLTFELKKDKWTLSFTAKTDITNDDDVMTDSDWGVPWWDPADQAWYEWVYEGSDERVLDVYSESDSEFDAIILDADIKYQLYKNIYLPKDKNSWFACHAGFKYIYQHFDFTTKAIQQWDLRDGRADSAGQPVYIPEESNMNWVGTGETTITYVATYHIPLIVLMLEEKLGNAEGYLTVGFSPYVMATDKDTHLIRIPGPIYAEGDCTGTARLFSLDLRYRLFKHWFAAFNFTLLTTNTEGEQSNYFDSGSYGNLTWPYYSWETDEEMESRMQNYTLTIGYSF